MESQASPILSDNPRGSQILVHCLLGAYWIWSGVAYGMDNVYVPWRVLGGISKVGDKVELTVTMAGAGGQLWEAGTTVENLYREKQNKPSFDE